MLLSRYHIIKRNMLKDLKTIKKKIADTILEPVGSRNFLFIVLYFTVVSLLELLAYKNGIISIVQSRIWLVTGVLLLLSAVFSFGYSIFKDIKNRQWFCLFGCLPVLFVLCAVIGNINFADISFEATQQVAAGLDAFKANDLNYTGVAFLGYSCRQYLMAAIPSVIFGRSVFALHLGFGIPFIVGIFALYGEIRIWLKENGLREEYALIPLYAIPAFRFIPEYYMIFEQTITPVAFTMIGIAVYMMMKRTRSFFSFVAIAWIGGFLANCYTPALASLGLLLCFLVFYAVELFLKNRKASESRINGNRYTIISILMVILNVVVFFGATVLRQRSDRINELRKDAGFFNVLFDSWMDFLNDKHVVFLGVFLGIVLLYMFLSLTGRFKFRDFTVSCWVLGVVFLANYMVGYTTYEKSVIMQRAMIIIPVIVTSIFVTIMELVKKYSVKYNFGIMVSVLLLLGMISGYNFLSEHQSFKYMGYVQPLKYAINDTLGVLKKEKVSAESEINICLFTDNIFQHNIQDYAVYFFPKAHTVSGNVGTAPEDMDLNLPTVYISESPDHMNITGNVEMKTFRNLRYKTNHVWYVGFNNFHH